MAAKQLVVDTSVMVKWIRTEKEAFTKQADKLLRDLQKGKVELYAPELAKYEVGNVLIKRKLLPLEAKMSLDIYFAIPVRFIRETLELAEKTYIIADNLHITYYDASFLSLAQDLRCALITENMKHLGKSKTITVHSLGNY